MSHEQMRPGEDGVVDRSRFFGDRLTIDDPEETNPSAVQLGAGAALAGARSVASSANAPTLERATANPSLRTRQMCTTSMRISIIGSTATCSA